MHSLFCLLPASCLFLSWLILQPWSWRLHVTPKRRFIFNGLCGVVSQKIAFFTEACHWIFFHSKPIQPISRPISIVLFLLSRVNFSWTFCTYFPSLLCFLHVSSHFPWSDHLSNISVNRCSSVRIETEYELDDRGIWVRLPAGPEVILFFTAYKSALETTYFAIQSMQMAIFWR
jgi:hypothetical protein